MTTNTDLRYQVQLRDMRDGSNIYGTGGFYMVCQAGTGKKQAIYDKSGTQLNGTLAFVALTSGGMTFYMPGTSATLVDIHGIAPDGQWFSMKNVGPAGPNSIDVDRNRRDQVALIPFSATDATAGTEKDTGLDLPVGAMVSPNLGINVLTLEAAKTIDFGILSSEPSGSANGFGAALPVSALGSLLAKSASTATRGSLVGGATLDRGYSVVAGTQSVSYTTSSGSAAANGYIVLPYTLAAAY